MVNFKLKVLSSIFTLLVSSGLSFANSQGDGVKVKGNQPLLDSIIKQVVEVERGVVIKRADKFLKEIPRTVTASLSPRSAGGKHDFDEMNAKNNHGTWWHAQMASYARLVGDQKTWIVSDKNYDTWNFTLSDGRGLWKGLNFMLPFLKDKSKWTGNKDVDHWKEQPEARQFMLFAALAGNDLKWFDLWKSLAEKNGAMRVTGQ